ncbi:MAG TPA: acyl carrier protein [Chloroflexota bacterium]|jgi:acyl carrier protein|nr:acyl carrier protein [Chloroflexota bacterium]
MTTARSAEDVERWLIERLQARVGENAEPVDGHLPFSYYGLDSIDAVELAAELEAWLQMPVSATLTFDYPTASAIAAYLAGNPEAPPPTPAAEVEALLAELDLTAHQPSPSASGPTMK